MKGGGKILTYLSAFFLISFILLALFAPFLAPYSPYSLNDSALLSAPSWSFSEGFFLGTDDIGRDLLSRLIHGSRISLMIGLFAVIFSAFFGVLLGLLAGYFSGWVDQTISRFTDILMSLPSMLFALVIITLLGPSLMNTIIAVGIVSIPHYIRIVRAKVLEEKSKDYIEATRNFGVGGTRQITFHILPNITSPIIIQATLGFSEAILNGAALGFLGLGAQAPLPEWGVMLSDSRSYIETAPWLVTAPGLCILLMVLSFNILGDVLRDLLDPRLKGL